jgi:hypothetical protein
MYTDSMSEPAAPPPSSPATPPVLPHALVVMQPLVTWLLRSGVGYAEFVAALKPVFLKAAMTEVERIQGKPTDSALSLLSGLHRKDVRALAPTLRAPDPAARLGKPTPASQVATRWLTGDLPDTLPLAGLEPSFEALARSVSSDFHPRSVLQELVRLGVATEADGMVKLSRKAFVPDVQHEEARGLVAGSVADHLSASVHNLSSGEARKFLEQSVFADGLSAESARALEQLATSLWQDVLAAMVKAAVPLCEKDEPAGGDQRIRLGMFCYAAPMESAAPISSGDSPDHEDSPR